MKPIAPSSGQFKVMCEIAGAGFDCSATKRICSGAGWQMVADEPEFGFVQYFLWVGPGGDDRRLLSIGTPDVKGAPHLYLPLYYFPEEEGEDPLGHDRGRFDEAYRRLSDCVGEILGEPQRDGTYEHSHRSGGRYRFRSWRVPEGQVILLQDEHDIQFGMDVSLWLFPSEVDVLIPLPY